MADTKPDTDKHEAKAADKSAALTKGKLTRNPGTPAERVQLLAEGWLPKK